jgi:two-component system cell cycle sensor histidine kinase/response regulator CckA
MSSGAPARTILIVENDGPIRDLAGRFLLGQGFNVLTAANGPEALALAQRLERIDLLISDIDMPHMTGLALAQRLVERHSETRVLFISGFAKDIQATGLDRFWFLPKPFTSGTFSAKVNEILAQP